MHACETPLGEELDLTTAEDAALNAAWDTLSSADPANHVDPEAGCPKCGQTFTDALVWDDDLRTVECQDCGTVYEPGTAKIGLA